MRAHDARTHMRTEERGDECDDDVLTFEVDVSVSVDVVGLEQRRVLGLALVHAHRVRVRALAAHPAGHEAVAVETRELKHVDLATVR